MISVVSPLYVCFAKKHEHLAFITKFGNWRGESPHLQLCSDAAQLRLEFLILLGDRCDLITELSDLSIRLRPKPRRFLLRVPMHRPLCKVTLRQVPPHLVPALHRLDLAHQLRPRHIGNGHGRNSE